MVKYIAIMGGQYCQVLDNTNTHRLLCRYLILYRIYINREGGFRDLVTRTSLTQKTRMKLILPRIKLKNKMMVSRIKMKNKIMVPRIKLKKKLMKKKRGS